MVVQIPDRLAAGRAFREITTEYFPDLTEEDIRACLAFA